MAEQQLQRVCVKHEAIMDALIANPAMKKSDLARQFGVSATWLSIVIHSDVFQAQLKEKSKEVFDTTVVPLRDQLLGVARVGVEKLGEAMENASVHNATDRDFVADTTDSILKNLGYSPRSAAPANPAAPSVQVTVVDSSVLAEAREKMRAIPAPAPPLEHKEVSVDEGPVPPAEEL